MSAPTTTSPRTSSPPAAAAPARGQTRTSLLARLTRRRGHGSFEFALLFLAVQAACVAWSLAAPDQFRYLDAANISVLLASVPPLAVLALGVGVLMISGEFDLSVGANYIFSSIVAATQINAGMNPVLAVVIGLAVGAVIGLFNGVVTVRFRIPSFIVTLGTMSFWVGASLFYNGTAALNFTPSPTLQAVMAGSIGIVPAGFLWLLGLGVAFWAILHRHGFGNHIFAVGGNRSAAAAIGIRPNRVKVITFTVAGACAALAGMLAAVQVGSIQPGAGGALSLQAIAACVVGGAALYGGTGTVVGMVLGAALIYTLQDILLLLAAPSFYLDVFVGLLVVAAAILNQAFRGRTS